MANETFLIQFQPISNLKKETNFELRKWDFTWWMNQRSIMKILARHDSTYEDESGTKYFKVDSAENPSAPADSNGPEAKRSKNADECQP